MKYFFPDSQDFVDPSFDFETEQKSILRVRQRDDVYAHELITQKPYDGLLVSKAIVDGLPGHSCKTRYSTGQRFRFYREGAHRYFRLGRRYEVMGDSGAFSYVKFNKPPYSVDDLIEFYVKAGVNKGVSLDHVIFGYETKTGDSQGVEQDRVERKAITLENANSFIKRSADHSFESFGVAQGWDRKSYIDSALALKKMGYKRVTLGGIITLNSDQICSLLDDINQVVNNKLSFHLLGISRVDSARLFKDRNVVSIDSTTPLKQAFMNLDKNYVFNGKNYCAIRVRQSHDNPQIRQLIAAGRMDQREVVLKEKSALNALKEFDRGNLSLDVTLDRVMDYESLFSTSLDVIRRKYARTLEAHPWRSCRCNICKTIGIEVIIFRGSERNKRRGYHNLYQFYKSLDSGR